MKTIDTGTKVMRYDALDGLRVLGAAGIVLMHVQKNTDYVIHGFVFTRMISSFADLVFMFMIISSFSMCCGYYEKIMNRELSWEAFYNKRFAKVWPFFAGLSLLDFIVSPSMYALQDVVTNLTMFFGFVPETGIEVIGVGWFLGLIFVFYYIFPFFCYLLSKKTRAWLSFAAAIILNLLSTERFHLERTSIVYSGMFLVAGGLIYLYKDVLSRFANRYRWLILIGIAAVSFLNFAVRFDALLTLIVYSLIVIYALKPRKGNSLLANPFMKFVSSISLEIYLSHMVIFRIIEMLNLTKLSENDVISYLLTVMMTLGGTVVFSWIMQKSMHLLSKRIIAWKRKISKCPKN